MSLVSTQKWEWLEQWSPTAFILAGVLFLLGLGLTVQEFSSTANTVSPLFAIGAFIATFIGLFGLYPRLDDATPKGALAGVVSTTVALLAVVGLFISVVGSTLLLGTPLPEGPGTIVFFLLALISAGLSFLFYGGASLKTRVPSRTVGILLVIPALVWPGYALLEQVFGVIDFNPIAVFVVVAVALLAIGFVLRTEVAQGDRATPTV